MAEKNNTDIMRMKLFQRKVIQSGGTLNHSSAPVSSDPWAGKFLYYNLGFPAIPF